VALDVQSKESPREIMMEVLKALQDLEISWKKLGSYCLKCRWVPPVAASRARRSNSDSPMISASLGTQNSPMLSGSLQQGVELHERTLTPAVSGDSEDSQVGEEHNAVKFEVQVCSSFLVHGQIHSKVLFSCMERLFA
jgi:hypothetical protein